MLVIEIGSNSYELKLKMIAILQTVIWMKIYWFWSEIKGF